MHQVFSGLECWMTGRAEAARLRRGARLGLLAHPASVDRRGRHIVELFHESPEHRLVRLFAPEHGLWGHEQDMETVDDAVDPRTGLPVISLYGTDQASLRVKPEQLDGLDAIVCDLQDVGSRYYTFVYTLSFLMEAASAAGLPVILLDRPNPIGGLQVEGPILRRPFASFVGRYPIPVRHGMTLGELAGLFNDIFEIGCDLRVVPLQGWERVMHFDRTGLPWVPPSPNMPTVDTARVYPGGCLIEGSNLSEGRGTTLPFELVGAPWIDGRRLAESLRAEGLPGVAFRAASFRPMFQKHAGAGCGGVQVLITDRESFRPFATYLVLLREARRLDPQRFDWRREAYEFETHHLAIDLLLGRDDLRPMLESGVPLVEIEALWREELEGFEETRKPFLLY